MRFGEGARAEEAAERRGCGGHGALGVGDGGVTESAAALLQPPARRSNCHTLERDRGWSCRANRPGTVTRLVLAHSRFITLGQTLRG